MLRVNVLQSTLKILVLALLAGSIVSTLVRAQNADPYSIMAPEPGERPRAVHKAHPKPSMAAQPLPGWRLLQATPRSRKYGQRVLCRRFPPTLAMFRI